MLVATVSPVSLAAQRFVVDVGVSKIDWFSPEDWGPAVGVQGRLFGTDRLSAIAGVRGLFGLETPGFGVSRRSRVATGLLGAEARVARLGRNRLYVAASLAQSYQWSRYTFENPLNNSLGTEGNGFTWTRAILGLRLNLPTTSRFGVSIRADVQPRFGELRSWNPGVSVGLSY